MSIYHRKDGRWQVTYRDEDGKLHNRTFPKGKKGKSDAEEFEVEVKYNKIKKKPVPRPLRDGIYMDELFQEWVDAQKAKGRGRQWLRDWAHIFNTYLAGPLCEAPARNLTQANILEVVNKHWSDAAQSTRNRYIRYLKTIFNYGVEQGHLQENPLSKWKPGKEERRKSRLTLEDLRKIQEYASRKGSRCLHLAWALELAWAVPARPGNDLYGMTFARNVSYDRGGIEVYHSKVMRYAFIHVSDEFLWELKSRERKSKTDHLIEYQGHPVKRMDTSIANCAENLGLSYRPIMYDVRHLWITTALDQGFEPSVIAHMAGTSLEMIHANYYEPHAVEQGRMVEGMPGLGKKQSGKVLKISE